MKADGCELSVQGSLDGAWSNLEQWKVSWGRPWMDLRVPSSPNRAMVAVSELQGRGCTPQAIEDSVFHTGASSFCVAVAGILQEHRGLGTSVLGSDIPVTGVWAV